MKLFLSILQILCNGPGTCIPLCLAGLILKVSSSKRKLGTPIENNDTHITLRKHVHAIYIDF